MNKNANKTSEDSNTFLLEYLFPPKKATIPWLLLAVVLHLHVQHNLMFLSESWQKSSSNTTTHQTIYIYISEKRKRAGNNGYGQRIDETTFVFHSYENYNFHVIYLKNELNFPGPVKKVKKFFSGEIEFWCFTNSLQA